MAQTEDFGFGVDRAPSVKVHAAVQDSLKWRPVWTIKKYDAQGALFEEVTFADNMLLDDGITRLLKLVSGDTSNPYNNANARLGVGSDTTAAAANQTALLDVNAVLKGMDSGFPSVTNQTITFQATFGPNDANFDWREFGVDNGSGAAELLNRKVDVQGTKASGQTWSLALSITIA